LRIEEMPYIKQEDRTWVDEEIKLIVDNIENSGDLCYVIYKLLKNLTEKQGIRFSTMSSLISEVECAKLEYYRRIVAPYEDTKISENGDVI
jgi:RNA processing factor Prp31